MTLFEDKLPRPFTGTLAWASDGRGVEVCVEAQQVRYRTVKADETVIEIRRLNTGAEFTKHRCDRCGGFHLRRA